MNRVLAIAAAIAIAVSVAVVGCGDDDGRREVGAVFDTARGLVPGQLVKIAGTRVGEISELELLRREDGAYKAFVTLDVPERFRFHADASCKILPEGLISENYIECDPGRRGTLADGPHDIPTVPLERTSASVSLQDVLNVFSVPTPDRLRMFLDTLGLATAGRGEDLNAIIRRANPALAEANRVFEIVADQNQALATAVGQTDTILARLAENDADVSDFVERAAGVTRTTADHRTALGDGIRGLPAMLDALERGLHAVDRVAVAAPPLLANLRAAAPGLERVTAITPVFSDAVVPGLRSLGDAAATGRRTVGPATPFVKFVRQFARRGSTALPLLEQLLVDVRDTGGFDGLSKFFYSFAGFTSPYDAEGHLVGLYIALALECYAVNAAGIDKPGCQHRHYDPKFGQVPINAPHIDPGPNSAALYDTGAGVSARTAASATPITPQQTKDLLEYMLK